MKTNEQDIKARRQVVLLQVEQAAREDRIKQKDRVDTFLLCKERINAAFDEAGLSLPGLNGKMMVADFAKQMADKLHSRVKVAA